ncbi:hypothetical protein NDU88_005068 [Pleurodeles waltl]|uniref:Uncharacterized protein n=1 Tax=Pleurodeles waltl TaxID=8319 RepID=A0AAV7PEL8_PLEWA|nr:hypothetical protein NDU88_005068 [Pleurodeles waltl]
MNVSRACSRRESGREERCHVLPWAGQPSFSHLSCYLNVREGCAWQSRSAHVTEGLACFFQQNVTASTPFQVRDVARHRCHQSPEWARDRPFNHAIPFRTALPGWLRVQLQLRSRKWWTPQRHPRLELKTLILEGYKTITEKIDTVARTVALMRHDLDKMWDKVKDLGQQDDYGTATQKKWRFFMEVKKKLQERGLVHVLLPPAQLHVDVLGKRHFFDNPEEAMQFIKNN